MIPNVLGVVVLTQICRPMGCGVAILGPSSSVLGQFMVEFVAASGRTQALVTLTGADIRAVADDDLVAVRPASARAS